MIHCRCIIRSSWLLPLVVCGEFSSPEGAHDTGPSGWISAASLFGMAPDWKCLAGFVYWGKGARSEGLLH